MKSKLTGGKTELLFTKLVLNKYKVSYYRCLETGFVQTEEPYWLNESYSNAITSLDVGLTARNIKYAKFTAKLIKDFYNCNSTYLDFGGGIGLFVRLMRDYGYNFYLFDTYASNILARYFSLDDCPKNTQFELVTAFEVFEHLTDPLLQIEQMLSHGKSILFSTELQPDNSKEIENWWYILPETGQHIAFYTLQSFQFIAEKYQLNFYTNGKDLHLLTANKFKANPLELMSDGLMNRIKNAIDAFRGIECRYAQKSLIGHDYEFIWNEINAGRKK